MRKLTREEFRERAAKWTSDWRAENGIDAAALIQPPAHRPPAGMPQRDTRTGPERWAWLHTFDWSAPFDRAEVLAKIAALADGLPSCACKRDWSKYVPANPPPIDEPALMPRWGFDVHNHVNGSRGVSPMAWAEACERYGWTDDRPIA